MKNWLTRLFSEGGNKKWYDSKAILYSVGVIITGVAGYFAPDAIPSIDLAQMREMTWSGLGMFALSLFRHWKMSSK